MLRNVLQTLARALSLFVLSDLNLQLLTSGSFHTPPLEKFPLQRRVAVAAVGPYEHFTGEPF